MRRAVAASRGTDRPHGVTFTLQVKRHMIEPIVAQSGLNLLAKANDRAALADEPEERRPQMSLVRSPASFACRAERLAWAASGPHRPVIGPPGASQSIRPGTETGEEMTLGISHNVCWYDILDRSFIDFSRRYHPRLDKLPQPLCREFVNFVVVDHCRYSPYASTFSARSPRLFQGSNIRLNVAQVETDLTPLADRLYRERVFRVRLNLIAKRLFAIIQHCRDLLYAQYLR
jgi:hypothetical protein